MAGQRHNKKAGNGQDGHAAGERYLPEGVAEPGWYAPAPRGLEAKIGEKLARLRALDEEARRLPREGKA